MSVLISDPQHKKQRSDAHVEASEVYVAGLSKFVEEKDLRRLFSPVSRLNDDSSAAELWLRSTAHSSASTSPKERTTNVAALRFWSLKTLLRPLPRLCSMAPSSRNAK